MLGLHPDLPHLDRGQVLPANQKLSPIKAVFYPVYVPYRGLNLNVNTFLSPEGDRAGTRRRLRTLHSSRAPPVSSCGWSAAPPVRLHPALSGERLGLLYLSGCHWHLVTEARDAAQHPAGHRRAPLDKELSNPNVSSAVSPEVTGDLGVAPRLTPESMACVSGLLFCLSFLFVFLSLFHTSSRTVKKPVTLDRCESCKTVANTNKGTATITSESRCQIKMIFENTGVCARWKMNTKAVTRSL